MANKIVMSKKYKTRDGRAVRVLCTDLKSKDYSVVAVIADPKGYEWLVTATADGQYFNEKEHPRDLIEVSPWDDFKVDEPVMVRDSGRESWRPRYFAKVSGGYPCTWFGGATSWSSNNTPVRWRECRRPTEEELNKPRVC